VGHLLALRNVTEIRAAEDRTRAANTSLRRVLEEREAEVRQAMGDALRAAEEEARRIGHEVHATLCQELVGLARMTETLEGAPAAAPADRGLLRRIAEQSAHSARLAREFAHHLTLHDLEVGPFPEAVAVFAARFERLFGIATEFNCGVSPGELAPETSAHLYRIVSEAAANAARHGRARHVWIDLVGGPGDLVLSVSSDGAPLPDPAEIRPGLGMRQMQMRARLLGGTFSLQRGEAGLTLVQVSVPRPRPGATEVPAGASPTPASILPATA
jgi:signal transduction histidine kinase